MSNRISFLGHLALGAALPLVLIGCAPERSSTLTSYPLCRAGLDEYREVELSYGLRSERQGWEPVRKYEQLVLKVRPRPSLRFKQVLKTVERKPGMSSGELRFENVVGRTDQTRQKVWFVERSTGRILATLDRQTGQTTGPDDEPPAWAKPDGGLPLDTPGE
jgi:hypothetical protein